MDFNVVIPQPVHDRIDEIYHYIAVEKENPGDAMKLVDRIYRAIASLNIFPDRGADLTKGRYANMGFKWIPEGQYMIVYEINGNDVILQTVRHSLEDKSH